MRSWAINLLGPVLRPAFDALLEQLMAGVEDRTELKRHVLVHSDIQPKTFDTLVSDLAMFGLVVRLRKRGDRLRLTTLGRAWLAEQHTTGEGRSAYGPSDQTSSGETARPARPPPVSTQVTEDRRG